MKIKLISSFLFAFFVTIFVFSQKSHDFKPYYISFTKLHGFKDIDKAELKKVETDFYKKVIKKNPYILHYEFLYNYYENDDPDYIIMKVFKSWDDIEKALKENQRLIRKAWKDDDERRKFFKKQNKFYDVYYSNEIFTSAPLSTYKPESLAEGEKGQKLFYVLFDKLADYDRDDSLDAYRKYIKNVTYKNPYVKAYYAHKHYVGSDSRDFLQIFVVDSYKDLLKSFKKDKELLNGMIPDEKERNNFIDIYNKGVMRVRNGLYLNIPEISK